MFNTIVIAEHGEAWWQHTEFYNTNTSSSATEPLSSVLLEDRDTRSISNAERLFSLRLKDRDPSSSTAASLSSLLLEYRDTLSLSNAERKLLRSSVFKEVVTLYCV